MCHTSSHVKCQGLVYFSKLSATKRRMHEILWEVSFYRQSRVPEAEIKFFQFFTVACLMQPSAFCSVQLYKIKVQETSEMTTMTCAIIALKSSTAMLSLKFFSAFYSFSLIFGSLSVYARYGVSFPNNNNRGI